MDTVCGSIWRMSELGTPPSPHMAVTEANSSTWPSGILWDILSVCNPKVFFLCGMTATLPAPPTPGGQHNQLPGICSWLMSDDNWYHFILFHSIWLIDLNLLDLIGSPNTSPWVLIVCWLPTEKKKRLKKKKIVCAYNDASCLGLLLILFHFQSVFLPVYWLFTLCAYIPPLSEEKRFKKHWKN